MTMKQGGSFPFTFFPLSELMKRIPLVNKYIKSLRDKGWRVLLKDGGHALKEEAIQNTRTENR
jgi:hypothetical protein